LVAIRPLTPAELDDFLGFMEGPAFETNPQWAGCYCQFYLNKEQPSPENRFAENRKTACDRITAKTMQGYLAYEGDEVIGWVAANKANNFVALPATSDDAARIICFIVADGHQGKGVSTQLLNYAIEDLRSQGYKSIEAAPRAAESFDQTGYRGKMSTFLKAGFTAGPMIDDQHILVHMNFTA
jgi:GNAT superfamily N-acetyltransferase